MSGAFEGGSKARLLLGVRVKPVVLATRTDGSELSTSRSAPRSSPAARCPFFACLPRSSPVEDVSASGAGGGVGRRDDARIRGKRRRDQGRRHPAWRGERGMSAGALASERLRVQRGGFRSRPLAALRGETRRGARRRGRSHPQGAGA
jgi:hypothetical protein